MNELATLVCQWKIDIMYIFRCPVCGWPMCNSKCAKASVHRYWIGIIAYHRLPFANIFLTVDRKCTIVHCTYIWLDVAIFKWKHCFQGSGVQNIQGEGEKSWLFRLGFWGATSKNMVKCTVCKKEIMVFFSLLFCKKRLLNMNLIDSMWRFISQQIFCLRILNAPGIVHSGHCFEGARSKRKGCKSKALLCFFWKKD